MAFEHDQAVELPCALRTSWADARLDIHDHPDPTSTELRALARGVLSPEEAADWRDVLLLRPEQLERYLEERKSLGLSSIPDVQQGPAAADTIDACVSPLPGLQEIVSAHRRGVDCQGYREVVRDRGWSVTLRMCHSQLRADISYDDKPRAGCRVTISMYGTAGAVLQEWTRSSQSTGIARIGALDHLPQPPDDGGYFLVVQDQSN